jgi:hypothetical protein
MVKNLDQNRLLSYITLMDFVTIAGPEAIEKTVGALRSRGIAAEVLSTRGEALARLQAIIPAGATVMTGASVTLREIGFEQLLLSKAHPWRNLKDEILAEKDPQRQSRLRRQAALADCFIGSVHAVAQSGQIVVASATGSQLAAYVYASPHVIWVVGAQKITRTLEEGLRRVHEHILPHEEKRMRELSGGKFGTMVGKMLIFERESPLTGRKLTLLLVREAVGD